MTAHDALSVHSSLLSDLRRKRDEIDTAIRVIESIYGVQVPPSSRPAEGAPAAETGETGTVITPGAFLGLSIVDASKKLLSMRRQTLSSSQIAEALKAGGLAMTSVEPVNTIGSVLGRRFDQVGDIVRVERGTWGLQEWYPHTNFRRKESSRSELKATIGPDATAGLESISANDALEELLK